MNNLFIQLCKLRAIYHNKNQNIVNIRHYTYNYIDFETYKIYQKHLPINHLNLNFSDIK